ncbi:putative elicitin [Plasmopara halstedii]
MNIFVFVSFAALAATTNAATCDTAALQLIITSPNATACMNQSNFTATSLTTPTTAELARMCASDACISLLSEAQTAAPSECTVGTFSLYADLITPLNDVCDDGSLSSTPRSTNESSNSTTDDATSTSTPTAPPATTSGASVTAVSLGVFLATATAVFL